MGSTLGRAAVAALAVGISTAPALAENWLIVMPDDPYSQDGMFHMFDVDSAFEDRTTGYVSARMVFDYPDDVDWLGVETWFVWAFDCAGYVYFVSSPDEEYGTLNDPQWRATATSLAEPHMGGVTNVLGQRLCALKGSLPLGSLP